MGLYGIKFRVSKTPGIELDKGNSLEHQEKKVCCDKWTFLGASESLKFMML